MAQTLTEPAREVRPQTAVNKFTGSPLAALASLRLTVVLLAMSIFLVFVGTLAQIDGGIWTIVSQYFRSLYVFVPLQLFWQLGQVFLGLPEHRLPVWLAFPYPGGWTLGTLLLANLVAAHLSRFRLAWRRGGVLMLHAGLIVLMLGELVTGLFQVEARMTIGHGETVNFTENSREVELAVIDTSDPNHDTEVTIPEARLRAGGTVSHPDLPVDVEVVEFLKNAELIEYDNKLPADAVFTSQTGTRFVLVHKDEASGVEVGSHEDAPTATLKLRHKSDGQVIGTRQVSVWFSPDFTLRTPVYRFAPQGFTLDGKVYRLELRGRRDYTPYALRLDEFRFDRYPGTQTPRNYSSRVRLTDAERGEDREVLIRMNEPLTYAGATFYQSKFTPDEKGTVLQVTRNPGVWMPYISCALIILGMVWHFGLHLVGFLGRAVTP